MLFDSPAYFVFLIPVVLLYWRLNCRAKNIFLLLASYFFYGWWDWRFLALMIGSTTMDFLIAQKITPDRCDANRRKWLIFSLVLNFSILGTFKYFNFFVDSFSTALNTLGIHNLPLSLIRIILPPGISFYTFQEVAYIVDVYKGRLAPAKSFIEYGLFVSLFPHLIAGPIQKPGHLLPQVQRNRVFDADRFFDGLMLIFSGLVRKCVVADNCALLANAAFSGQFGKPNFWVVLLGTYAFAWQVYGDFSGYSDIARGSAQLMGFHFMVNFRQPYLSRRLQDFWRRWHISLSTWLRDYLYIPLGGSAGGNWKTSRNLVMTMILAGLWHGAAWTFVIFGAIHGLVLAIERLFWPVKMKAADGAQPKPYAGLLSGWGERILTFNVFCLSLAFFRAPSLNLARQFLSGLSNLAWRSEYASAFFMLAIFAIPLFVVDLLMEASNEEYPFANASYAVRTALATVSLVVLALFSGSNLNAFVYFRF
ncbi:MAG: membrane-bound O-acyltransferase family protein [Acidobacteria bacterium]|nr:MAG: membrane-bound O-acyltransferase family protein [Acidobacteriota bacterium]